MGCRCALEIAPSPPATALASMKTQEAREAMGAPGTSSRVRHMTGALRTHLELETRFEDRGHRTERPFSTETPKTIATRPQEVPKLQPMAAASFTASTVPQTKLSLEDELQALTTRGGFAEVTELFLFGGNAAAEAGVLRFLHAIGSCFAVEMSCYPGQDGVRRELRFRMDRGTISSATARAHTGRFGEGSV